MMEWMVDSEVEDVDIVCPVDDIKKMKVSHDLAYRGDGVGQQGGSGFRVPSDGRRKVMKTLSLPRSWHDGMTEAGDRWASNETVRQRASDHTVTARRQKYNGSSCSTMQQLAQINDTRQARFHKSNRITSEHGHSLHRPTLFAEWRCMVMVDCYETTKKQRKKCGAENEQSRQAPEAKTLDPIKMRNIRQNFSICCSGTTAHPFARSLAHSYAHAYAVSTLQS